MGEIKQYIRPVLDWLISQFGQIREAARELLGHIPGAGKYLSNHAEIFLIGLALIAAVILIKPLIKWAVVIGVIGSLTAYAISIYLCLPFTTVLPYALSGVSLLILAVR